MTNPTTFDPARPRYTLPLAGKEYELLGTMALIEAVEYALKRGIVTIAVEAASDMAVSDLARLLSAVLTASGHKLGVNEATGLLWDEVGLTGEAMTLLRLHLYAFLGICLMPPEKREAKAKDMGELIGKLAATPAASPGKTTRKPASAS